MELIPINYDAISYVPKSDEDISELKSLWNYNKLKFSFCEDLNGFIENFPQIQHLPYTDIIVLKKRKLYNFYYKNNTFRDRFDGCQIISDDDAHKITGTYKRKAELKNLKGEKTEDNFIPLALLMQDETLQPSHYAKMTNKEYENVIKYIRENKTDITSDWFCDMTDWAAKGIDGWAKASIPDTYRVLVAEQYSDLLYIYMNMT